MSKADYGYISQPQVQNEHTKESYIIHKDFVEGLAAIVNTTVTAYENGCTLYLDWTTMKEHVDHIFKEVMDFHEVDGISYYAKKRELARERQAKEEARDKDK